MPIKDLVARAAYVRAYYKKNREKSLREAKAWKQRNRDRYRALVRENEARRRRSDPDYREKQRRRSADYYRRCRAKRILLAIRHNATERGKARRILQHAVRDGLLIRPSVCDNCGSGGRIQAHHPDYSRPMSVIWVCSLCHGDIHRRGG